MKNADKSRQINADRIQNADKGRQEMDIEVFTRIADEEAQLLPEEFYRDLSGGVVIDQRLYMSEGAVADDLFTLGHYKSGPMGKQVVLYYGTFERMFGHLSDEDYRLEIRRVLRHEFRHHMENLSGMHGSSSLEGEDARKYADYLRMHARG